MVSALVLNDKVETGGNQKDGMICRRKRRERGESGRRSRTRRNKKKQCRVEAVKGGNQKV
jgi:hypothetical protein